MSNWLDRLRKSGEVLLKILESGSESEFMDAARESSAHLSRSLWPHHQIWKVVITGRDFHHFTFVTLPLRLNQTSHQKPPVLSVSTGKGVNIFNFFTKKSISLKQREKPPLKTPTTIKMKFNIATLVATACASPLTDRETVISPAQLKVEVRNRINIIKINNI